MTKSQKVFLLSGFKIADVKLNAVYLHRNVVTKQMQMISGLYDV